MTSTSKLTSTLSSMPSCHAGSLFIGLLAVIVMALPVSAGQGTRDEALRGRLQARLQADGAPRRIAMDDLAREAGQPNDLALSRAASAVLRAALAEHLEGLVVSCHDGVLSLRGRVAEAADLYRASDLCRHLEGVRAVDNGLTSVDGQRLVVSAQKPPVPGASETFSFVTKDRWGGSGMTLQVSAGVVTVEGTINGDGARQWVISRLRSVRGVRAIRDRLTVRQEPGASDVRLGLIVYWKLATSPELRELAPGLEVVSRSGVVHLSGRVQSAEQRLLAETLAVSTSGVLVVSSALTLAPQQTAPSGPPR